MLSPLKQIAATLVWKLQGEPIPQPHAVKLFLGDSGDIMSEVIAGIQSPAIFWLDGHYSAGETSKGNLDTPILKEIDAVAAHPNARGHVLLIDDARCFDGTNDYPTEEKLKAYLLEKGYLHFEKLNHYRPPVGSGSVLPQ